MGPLEAARLAPVAARILGLRLLTLALVASAAFSGAAAYAQSALARLTSLYSDEARPPEGLGLASIYSGVAALPVTGALPASLAGEASRLEGVVEAWGEPATPALVNGSLAVVRGVPPRVLGLVGVRLVEGSPLEPGDLTGALVGAGLAGRLGVRPGDVLVVYPAFSRVPAVLTVRGVVDGPEPYRSEVIVDPGLGLALRGGTGYAVVRILYDPHSTSPQRILRELGFKAPEAALLRQAVYLWARGYVNVTDPSRLQEYFNERLGVPREAVLLSAAAVDALLSLLAVPLAWALAALRRGELAVLHEVGVPWRAVKASLLLASLPAVAAGVALGMALAYATPAPSLMGYPLGGWPGAPLAAAHAASLLGLYSAGLALARVEGG